MNAAFPGGGHPGNVALLTDGRVLASGPETSNQWWTLSPDYTGSYANGSWTQVGSSTVGRLFNPAFILRDGRYWNCGGEYTTGSDRSECEIFDPVTNTWSVVNDMPQLVADAPAAELANGKVLVLSAQSTNSYLFNSFGVNPPNWTSAASYNGNDISNESSALLLPDGSVLVGSSNFRRYLPSTNAWVTVATTPGTAVGEFLLAPSNAEIGPFMLLHDGRALVLGGNAHNGLYTPPTTLTGQGSWTLAADTPVGPDSTKPFNHADAPSCVEPDGRVLTVVTNDQSGLGYATPVFYEYNPSGNSWSPVADPNGPIDDVAERVRLLDLPNGQLLVTGYANGSMWLYNPAGSPNSSWRPSISSISGNRTNDFTLNGSQLNGLTTGGYFGDDGVMNTNYPIVSLADSAGNVTYCRTYNVDQMAPRKSQSGSVKFHVPSTVKAGTYTVRVAANGVGSSNTKSLTLLPAPPTQCGALLAQQGLVAGATPTQDRVSSCNGVYTLVMQSGGNLILTQSGVGTIWQSGTTGTGTQAIMQGDGNFVVTGTGFATNTYGQGGAYLAVQNDGNLVVYTAAGIPIWARGQPAAPTACGRLLGSAGEGLSQGTSLTSCDGRFKLSMQLDGNLVLYQGTTALWASNTYNNGNLVMAVMQSDGNLVLYKRSTSPMTAIWASNTSSANATLYVQNDGNVVIYNTSGTPIWASNTAGH